MMKLWLMALPLALNVAAIRVPVTSTETVETDNRDKTSEDNHHSDSRTQLSIVDSYHVQDEQPDLAPDNKDGTLVPVRYLLPPREDAPVFTYPPEIQSQDDWTPMVQELPKESRGRLFLKTKESKQLAEPIVVFPQQELPDETTKQWFHQELPESSQDESKSEEEVSSDQEPSRYLLPPLEDSEPSVNFDTSVPSTELRPPMPKPHSEFRLVNKLKPIMPTISLEMQPPSPTPNKYKNPTALYPKKYSKHNAYKPIAIPIRGYGDEVEEVPKAKPVKYVKPPIAEDDYLISMENEKKLVKYQQQEDKKRFQDEEEARMQQELVDSRVQEAFATPDSADDQQPSDSNYGNGEEKVYVDRSAKAEPTGPSERTEFRMHGLHGPNSYKFGYDTGKGKNRQFRYEERSNDGRVRGHYGYVDRDGKTQVVNYDAHPTLGFHAETATPA